MPVTTLEGSIPIELVPQGQVPQSPPDSPSYSLSPLEKKTSDYVVAWRNQLRTARNDKLTIWNECWQLYRGLEDWSDKEDWQSKIVIPKVWSSVKQATSVVRRLLSTSKRPYNLESINPDDLVTTIRAEQMTDLTRVFLDKAHFDEEFATGLEVSFILGLGVWKLWWGLQPRTITQVEATYGQRQLVQREILEGQLFMRAVDPYNFYWLPGSKFNRWVGTIEEVEISKWELMDLASQGYFDKSKIKNLSSMKIEENQKQSQLRFTEQPRTSSPKPETDVVKLTDFYGPLVIDGEMIERMAHVVIANDTCSILPGDGFTTHPYWMGKPPYVGFSPLSLPFRTEGVGLIEMVRQINKALSKLANLSVDTLLFRLLPIFEVTPEVYENPEDFETGLTPGKIFRRNNQHIGMPGITPVTFEDISQGAVQVSAQLDRAHQEGALVSEIQQGIPRYRGVQTATEIDEKAENQKSFFGGLATDIEQQAIAPIVEMASDLIFQFIDTATDPRVASVLGVGADVLRGMTKEELMEMIQGDYKIKVSGISGQLEKAEMLQNLIQFMNLIGQNPEAWLPYLNQNALLRRILEAFRPAIHDIEQIIADPATVEAHKAAMQSEALNPEILRMLPQMVDMAQRAQAEAAAAEQAQQQAALQEQQMAHDLKMQQLELEGKQADIELTKAQAKAAARAPAKPSK